MTQSGPLPPDDLSRQLAVARPDSDEALPHIGLVGDTYTILVSGEQTAGAYTLIDMYVPTGGGPAPHRHDFEELFIVLDGEIEATFRGEVTSVKPGESINIPADAPHSFTNAGPQPARVLCICTPAGQETFFGEVGQRVATRTTAPEPLDPGAQAAFMAKVIALAPRYRTELLPPAA